MKIIGVDPSISATGLVYYDTETKFYAGRCLRIKTQKDFRHLMMLKKEVKRFIVFYNPEHIFVENPIFFRGRIQGHIRTVQFHALLRELFLQLSIPYTEFAPTSMKKLFTGSGDASKGDVVKTALDIYGRRIYDNNVADAFGLAIAGAKKLGAL